MYVDLAAYKANLTDDSPELTNILIAQKFYEGSEGFLDPHGRLLICSEEVNAIVDRFDVGHDNQGRTFIVPFVIDKGVRIHSDPPLLYVGNLNQSGFGEIPDPNLEDLLTEADLPRAMIVDVKNYFKSRVPVNWNLDSQ